MNRFVAIGHLVKDIDTTRLVTSLGGGAAYSSITASRLGIESHAIVKCPLQHPYIAQLERLGVVVHVLPSELNTITTNVNDYHAAGPHTKEISEVQEQITNLIGIPNRLLRDSTILVAPAIAEVEMGLVRSLSETGLVSITAQGYFRSREKDGKVMQIRWSGFEKSIKNSTVILSNEDIIISGQEDKELLERIKIVSPLVVLTQGAKGVKIFQQGKEPLHIGAFTLNKEEIVDLTGSGDVFATVFINEMARTRGDVRAASVAACFFAAIKIMGKNGSGVDSIPTLEQVRKFADENPKRLIEYLKQEGVDNISLFQDNV